jgi:photosystem II stability/assembly factor-like uncharacterized protein
MLKNLFYLLFLIPVTVFSQWIPETSGTTFPLQSVYFNNPETGFAVGGYSGQSGTILKTVDGGTTWAAVLNGTSQFESVYF